MRWRSANGTLPRWCSETTQRRGKKERDVYTLPLSSLIHATDFADRLERYILPPAEGRCAVVCADRYAYTAFARDAVRGVNPAWVRNLYRFALQPNPGVLFQGSSWKVALGRILGGRNALKYYEAGLGLGLSRNIEESFRIFQGRILVEYEAMIEEMGKFHAMIDATKSIEAQQRGNAPHPCCANSALGNGRPEFWERREPWAMPLGKPLTFYRTAASGRGYGRAAG